MISLKETLLCALEGMAAELAYGHPLDFTQLPLVCWRETQNRTHAQADAQEHLAEIGYTLDIYAEGMEEAGAIFADMDARMQAAGFRRETAAELFEPGRHICHTNVRYRALADAQGNIYQ